MKKALLTIAVAAAAFTAQAQDFRLGLGGGINTTWLANTNVSDAGDELDFAVTFGGSVGLEGIYSFSEKAGVSIGFLSSGHNQKYEGEISSGTTTETWESKLKMRYLDIPILFRLTSASGTYFELGPQIGILTSAKEDGENSSGLVNYEDRDVKGSLNGTNVAAILGFGVDIEASENIIVTAGLRLGYGFTDVTKEYTLLELAALESADELANATSAAHFNDKDDFSYEATNRVFGGLHLGVSYKFGSAK